VIQMFFFSFSNIHWLDYKNITKESGEVTPPMNPRAWSALQSQSDQVSLYLGGETRWTLPCHCRE